MTLVLAMLAPATGATLEVELTVEESDLLTRPQVESVVWHALARDLGHDATFVQHGEASAATPGLDQWRMEVTWDPQVLHIGTHLFATMAPRIRVQDDHDTREWLGTAIVLDHSEHGWVSLPDVALMRTLDRASPALTHATWHATPETGHLNLVVSVDEELRGQWGDAWVARADERVHHANLLLRQAGVQLEVVGYEAVQSRQDASLHQLLRDLDARPLPDRAELRIGLTGQVRADAANQVEDVAVAYVPGHTVLLADQVPAIPTLGRWDAAEEGTALAHEVIHALGVPHLDEPGHLMSEFKAGMLHKLSPEATELAQTAMRARATSDPLRAVLLLGDAAEQLADRATAIAYVAHNLDAGIGIPGPGLVDPDQLTTLTNVAIGRYFLQQADESPADARRYRHIAAFHSRAAFASIDPRDDWTPLLNEFADALCSDSPWRDATGRPICEETRLFDPQIRLPNPALSEVSD